MNILFGNYGNNTLALIQWAHENQVPNAQVVHVVTGWADAAWEQHVQRAQALVNAYEFKAVTLQAPVTFAQAVLDRGRFHNQKFQWCAPFLKGLPLLEWLDEVDTQATATILLGTRRADSRARSQLPEFTEASEHFGGRRVWHPLVNHDNPARAALLHRAGFTVLPHRSLECAPCIHSTLAELQHLSPSARKRVAALEKQVQQPLFPPDAVGHAQGIEQAVAWVQQQPISQDTSLETYDRGCGSFYACGE